MNDPYTVFTNKVDVAENNHKELVVFKDDPTRSRTDPNYQPNNSNVTNINDQHHYLMNS